MYKEVTDGGNLIFEVGGEEVQEDEEIRLIWDEYQKEKEKNSENGEKRVCLVTGERTEIARIHPAHKRITGGLSQAELRLYLLMHRRLNPMKCHRAIMLR